MLPFILLVLLAYNVNAQIEKVFVLNLNYDQGEITQNSLFISYVYFNEEKNQPEDGYYLSLNSIDNEELFKLKFNFPLKVFDLNVTELDQGEVKLIVPYFEESRNIEIYSSDGIKILDISLSNLIENMCGDGRCDEKESYSTCNIDCKEEFKLVDDIRSISTNKKLFLYLPIIIVLIILLLVAIIWKKNNRKV